jgi:hypothetical protein
MRPPISILIRRLTPTVALSVETPPMVGPAGWIAVSLFGLATVATMLMFLSVRGLSFTI